MSAALYGMLAQIQTAFATPPRPPEESARPRSEENAKFVADACHELRTPLTTIRGFAEFTGRARIDDRAADARIECEAVGWACWSRTC